MKIIVAQSPDSVSEKAAYIVAEYIKANPGRLLCFSAGETPKFMLREIVRLHMQGEIDLNRMYYAALDEWVGLGRETNGSCAQIMLDNFYEPAGIDPARCVLWDGLAPDMNAECARMEKWIKQRGPIGLAVLGIGPDGHVGFNEPGDTEDMRCHVAVLSAETREAGGKYFEPVQAPSHGVTIGLKRLLQADNVMLMAIGEKKAPIMRRALMGAPTAECPASLLQQHERFSVLTDKALFAAMGQAAAP